MDRAGQYEDLRAEIESVVAGETYIPARYASAACLLSGAFSPRFFWTGFYVVDPLKPSELVVAHIRERSGVCGFHLAKGFAGRLHRPRKP